MGIGIRLLDVVVVVLVGVVEGGLGIVAVGVAGGFGVVPVGVAGGFGVVPVGEV